MRTFILALLGFFPLVVACQAESRYPEYYNSYNQVSRLEKQDQLADALRQFQVAEKLVDRPPVQHGLKAMYLSTLTGQCELAAGYFQQAVDSGFEFESISVSFDECPELSNASVTRTRPLDEAYSAAVEEMYLLDKEARKPSGGQHTRTMVDSLNIHRLLTLMEEKGYPSSYLIGEMAARHAFIVLLHFDADTGNQILQPLLEQAYHAGEISPENYAWSIDRRRNWGPDKLDPYYYQLPTRKYFEMTEAEIAAIDERRASIGLRPLSEMGIVRTPNGGGGISIQN